MSRRFFLLTVAIAVIYVPLALNYAWPLFAPGMSRWQDSVNTLINGRDYAVGDGSVESVRHGAYSEHRVVLMVHTTLAGLALALGLFQFSPRLRARQPSVHRWTGRRCVRARSARPNQRSSGSRYWAGMTLRSFESNSRHALQNVGQSVWLTVPSLSTS